MATKKPNTKGRAATRKPAKTRASRARGSRQPLLVDLALQGGGSHGAFTWGVLDRLLEEPWLEFEAASGTSAGAMNAVVLADGLAAGGRDGARAALAAFWKRVADAGAFSPFRRGPVEMMTGSWSLDHSPVYVAMDLASRMFSPYDVNPLGTNPLEDVLAASVDFARVARSPFKVFVTATNVRTGKGRVFRNAQISPKVLLASACLPTMFQAVEIDGDPYWDGGFSGNPSMGPLIRECVSDDTILVQINPIERTGTPRSAREIHNRINEIAFNSSLLKQLMAGAMLRRVAQHATAEQRHWAVMRMHLVSSPLLGELGASSKVLAEWGFLTMLRDEGRRAAQGFLDRHAADLGVRSSLDLETLLEDA